MTQKTTKINIKLTSMAEKYPRVEATPCKESVSATKNQQNEGQCGDASSMDNDNLEKDTHHSPEGRMHRTNLAHLISDATMLLDLFDDNDDLPPWLERKITLASDYIKSATRYMAGERSREVGRLADKTSGGCVQLQEQLNRYIASNISEAATIVPGVSAFSQGVNLDQSYSFLLSSLSKMIKRVEQANKGRCADQQPGESTQQPIKFDFNQLIIGAIPPKKGSIPHWAYAITKYLSHELGHQLRVTGFRKNKESQIMLMAVSDDNPQSGDPCELLQKLKVIFKNLKNYNFYLDVKQGKKGPKMEKWRKPVDGVTPEDESHARVLRRSKKLSDIEDAKPTSRASRIRRAKEDFKKQAGFDYDTWYNTPGVEP